MPEPWLLPTLQVRQITPIEKTAFGCFGDAAWEGRMSAMRWLIMFVGIRNHPKENRPIEWELGQPTDVRIDALPGSALFTPAQQGADILAQMWERCSKATSHATDNTGHSSPDEPHLAEALFLIIQHLEATIYAKHGTSLHHYTMKS